MNSTIDSIPTWGTEYLDKQWKDGIDWQVSVKLVFAGLAGLFMLSSLFRNDVKVKAPFVGYRSFWEPTFILRFRFCQGAWPIVMEGYNKFKNNMFKVRRNDADILVISNKYVDELRALPDAKASAIHAHIKNLLGPYSTTNILLESDLHTRTLQTKLTPSLGSLVHIIRDELNFAIGVEVPKADDWVEVSIYDILLRIVARISARIFVGFPLCRNEEWLETSIHYTENIFMTVIALRMFPGYMHPFVVRFLPSWYRIHQNLRLSKKLIVPLVNERRKTEAEQGPDYQKPVDFLQWMMDAADEDEGKPYKLAHRQLLVSLASIHTTTMSAAHALYDLCAHREFLEPVREEMEAVLSQDGGWNKTTLTKMRKLDSFLKESQRINPPSLLAFNRIATSHLTLSDGVKLPKGTHVAVAAAPIMMDASVVPDPDTFDPFRWYRKREDPAEANKHQFAVTSKDHLHFGHGKFSCPGRFFAANEIKMLLSHLLLEYDFKYPEGKGRPKNMTADENIYPDPSARLLMRKRTEKNEKVSTML